MSSLKQGLSSLKTVIKSHKLLFAGLCIIQLAILGAAAITFLHYQLTILQDIQNVLGPLQGATFDADALQAGQPFVEDFLPIYQGYRKLVQDLTAFGIWSVILTLGGGSILWLVSYHLVHKLKLRDVGRILLRYVVSSAVAILLFILSLTFIIQAALAKIDEGSFTAYFVVLGIIGFLLYTILLTATLHARTASWKEWGLHIAHSLTRNLGKLLLVFLEGWALLAVVVGLMALGIVLNSVILLIALLLFGIVLVLVRLYFIIRVAHKE